MLACCWSIGIPVSKMHQKISPIRIGWLLHRSDRAVLRRTGSSYRPGTVSRKTFFNPVNLSGFLDVVLLEYYAFLFIERTWRRYYYFPNSKFRDEPAGPAVCQAQSANTGPSWWSSTQSPWSSWSSTNRIFWGSTLETSNPHQLRNFFWVPFQEGVGAHPAPIIQMSCMRFFWEIYLDSIFVKAFLLFENLKPFLKT